jgi:Ca2+-binding RTX toxin-like protein
MTRLTRCLLAASILFAVFAVGSSARPAHAVSQCLGSTPLLTPDYDEITAVGQGYVGPTIVTIEQPAQGCRLNQMTGTFKVTFGTSMPASFCANYGDVVQHSGTAVTLGQLSQPDTIFSVVGMHNLIFGFGGGDDITLSYDNFANVVYSGNGYDDVWYNSGTGGSQNQEIYGGPGNDLLFGSPGPDYLVGGAGEDYVYGDDDDDVIFGALSTGPAGELPDDGDYIYGEDGQDRLIGGAGADTYWDQEDMDGDLVWDFGGENYVNLYLGNDDVCTGGEGIYDGITTGPGDDVVWAGSGDDLIVAGSGHDLVHGEGGTDYIHGNEDDDELYGDGGPDTLDGGPGLDTLVGGTNNDVIKACDDPDVQDTLVQGGGGDDMFYLDWINGQYEVNDWDLGEERHVCLAGVGENR